LREVGGEERPAHGAVHDEEEFVGLGVYPCEDFAGRAAVVAGVAASDDLDVGGEAV